MRILNCLKDIVRRVNLLLLIPFLLIFSTVFVLNTELANDVVSTKYFWFYISIGICAISQTIYFSFFSNFRIKLLISDLLLFLFVMIGSLPFLVRAEAVNSKFILFVLLFVFYFYSRLILSKCKVFRYTLILFLIITALVESIWGLRQLYGFIPSQHSLFLLTGSFFNPGPYAGYLAMISPMTFYYMLTDYNVWNRKFNHKYIVFYIRWIVSATTILAILLVLPAAMSRAAWLASLGGCGVVGLLLLSKKYRIKEYISVHRIRVLKIGGIVFVFLIAATWGMYALKKDSADGRAFIWKNTISAIVKNPWGVGIGNFAGIYGLEQAAYFESGRSTEQEKLVAGNPEYAFNEYLQIGLEMGIAGLLLFLLIVAFALYKGIKNKHYVTLGSLIALLIFASMSYPFSVLPFLIVFAFLLADVQIVQYENLKYNKIKNLNRIPTIISLISLFIVVTFCLYNRYPTYQAYKDWKNAKMMYSMNLYADVIDSYGKLEPFLNDEVKFLFEYGQILSKTGAYDKSNVVLKRATRISCDPMLFNILGKNYQSLSLQSDKKTKLHSEYIKLAEQNFKMAASIVPNRLYPYYLLTKLYTETGNKKMAIETARLVLQKEPKVHSPAIDEMREEVRKILEVGNQN
ncbi:MAG: O-antigen ligase family protein [Paludibacter sp.]|nr:O-antigen ligase family protein [Paludibacter sp.]